MLGDLTVAEIEELLRDNRVGRIGCHAEGTTYVVPTGYAYDGECVYAQSGDGLKVRTMRANPDVCFEVEDIRDVSHWRSVIAWGSYEELWGHAEDEAIRRLRARFADIPTWASVHPDRGVADRNIFYRIRLTRKIGHFERP
jgi:nitroimidazol reductase NimA-like FMN-containing flavoprotein (pyridoxamine 5'-phosphate oxidase superfamily)